MIDLKKGELVNGDVPLALSDEFVRQLSVIREGEFVEKGGAPAVRILANATVRPSGDAPTHIVRGYISDSSLVRNFVQREPVQEPIQYFLAAINSQSDWLPIFRWLDLAGLNSDQAVALVEGENLSPKKRLRALERISGARSALVPVIKSLRLLVKSLLEGQVPEISTATELRRQMQAVRMAEPDGEAELQTLWAVVEKGYAFAWAPQNGGDLQSYVKAAAGRLDELAHATHQDQEPADPN